MKLGVPAKVTPIGYGEKEPMKSSSMATGLLNVTLLLGSFGAARAQIYSSTTTAATTVSNGEPYQTEVNTIMDIGQTSIHIPISDVPVTKRLVIRDVSGIIYGQKGERYKLILLTQVNSTETQWHPIQINGESFEDPEAKADATIFSSTPYINATRDSQGRIMRVSMVRGGANFLKPSFVRMTISGYLLPVESTPTRVGQ